MERAFLPEVKMRTPKMGFSIGSLVAELSYHIAGRFARGNFERTLKIRRSRRQNPPRDKPIRFSKNRNIVTVFSANNFINRHKTETMTKIQAITADDKPRQATTGNPATLRTMRDSGLYATITNDRQRQDKHTVFGSLDRPFRGVRPPLCGKPGAVRPRRGRARRG